MVLADPFGRVESRRSSTPYVVGCGVLGDAQGETQGSAAEVRAMGAVGPTVAGTAEQCIRCPRLQKEPWSSGTVLAVLAPWRHDTDVVPELMRNRVQHLT